MGMMMMVCVCVDGERKKSEWMRLKSRKWRYKVTRDTRDTEINW